VGANLVLFLSKLAINVQIFLYNAKFRNDKTYPHSGNKKRGISTMLFSDESPVDAAVHTVLDTVEVDEDMEDRDNVVGELMMATLYSPAVDKEVGGAHKKKIQSVVKQETEVVKALAQALNGPVMGGFGVADYEVHDGDCKTWFELGQFTSLKPDEMDEIAMCLARLAKTRRVQEAALAAM